MLKWINNKRNKKGFTLVELVVVIAILGILAAIAVPKVSDSITKAAKVAHNANVRTLESAALMAVIDGAITGAEVTWDDENATNAGWKPYIQSWPKVPSGLESTSVGTTVDYTVTIKSDGTIEVKPDKIENKDENEDENKDENENEDENKDEDED